MKAAIATASDYTSIISNIEETCTTPVTSLVLITQTLDHSTTTTSVTTIVPSTHTVRFSPVTIIVTVLSVNHTKGAVSSETQAAMTTRTTHSLTTSTRVVTEEPGPPSTAPASASSYSVLTLSSGAGSHHAEGMLDRVDNGGGDIALLVFFISVFALI